MDTSPSQSENMAQILIDAGEAGLWSQLESILTARLDKDPDDREALDRLALLSRQMGNLEKAAGLYKRLSRLDPHNASAKILSEVCAGRPASQSPPEYEVCAAPFVRYQNFLDAATRSRLDDLLAVQEQYMEELDVNYFDTGRHLQAKRDRNARLQYGVYCETDLRAIIQSKVEACLPAIFKALTIESFESKPHTLRLDITPEGGFGRMHQDVGFGARLIYLYYFHTLPKKYTGGDLLLFDQNVGSNQPVPDRFTKFVQEDNSLIVFAPHYFHEVTRLKAITSPLDRKDARLSVCGFIHPVDKGQ